LGRYAIAGFRSPGSLLGSVPVLARTGAAA
jgi:hypothetical protein